MKTLPELAAERALVRNILISNHVGHVEAADQIFELTGMRYSEAAVRRWRRGDYTEEGAQAPPDGSQIKSEASSQIFGPDDRAKLHGRLDELLDETNADPGATVGMRVSTWDSLTKGDDGEAEIHRMYGVQLHSRRLAPDWPVVKVADPVNIILPNLTLSTDRSEQEVALILPDPQIGFRFYADTGTFDPFHDEKALDIALQIAQNVQPDQIIWLGDLLDLAEFGKYEQEQAFAFTTQKTIQTVYEYLAAFGAYTRKQVVIEGNHDRRLQKMVTANAMAAFGLKQADSPEDWPVLSVPHLCRFEYLGVDYVGGYPAGEYWINERLKCIHGLKVRSGASTAKAVVDDERVSTIFGHIHRIETHFKTSNVHGGARVRVAHTPGCLCRIDGAVPSVHGSTTLDGRPVTHYEDWQQGVSLVHYTPGDGPFNIETAFINTIDGYETVAGGLTYTPRV